MQATLRIAAMRTAANIRIPTTTLLYNTKCRAVAGYSLSNLSILLLVLCVATNIGQLPRKYSSSLLQLALLGS